MMPTTASRDDWAQPLAALVACIRRDWDVPGTRAAISKARHRGTPLEIARALLRLAENQALRTPAMLHEDGSHWGTPTTVPTARQTRCAIDGHEHELASNCRICASDRLAAGAVDRADAPTLTEAQAARNVEGARAAMEHMAPRPLDPRELAAGETEERDDDE